MEQILTLVCKLQPTPEQVAKIEVTLKAFAGACNYANQTVKPAITNKRTRHGTIELRQTDGNYPEVILAIAPLVYSAADRVRQDGLTVRPAAGLNFQGTKV